MRLFVLIVGAEQPRPAAQGSVEDGECESWRLSWDRQHSTVHSLPPPPVINIRSGLGRYRSVTTDGLLLPLPSVQCNDQTLVQSAQQPSPPVGSLVKCLRLARSSGCLTESLVRTWAGAAVRTSRPRGASWCSTSSTDTWPSSPWAVPAPPSSSVSSTASFSTSRRWPPPTVMYGMELHLSRLPSAVTPLRGESQVWANSKIL